MIHFNSRNTLLNVIIVSEWSMDHGLIDYCSVTYGHDSSEISVYSPVNYESFIIIMIIFNDVYGNANYL